MQQLICLAAQFSTSSNLLASIAVAAATTITLNFATVDGTSGTPAACEGCLIQPVGQVLEGKGIKANAVAQTGQSVRLFNTDLKSAIKGRVKNGQVTFTVPTNMTKGLSFAIRTDGSGLNKVVNGQELGTPVLPFITIAYKGAQVGSAASPNQSLRAQQSSPCWAGTNKDSIELDVIVNVVKVEGEAATTQPGRYESVKDVKAPAAWLDPTARPFGGWSNIAYKGTGMVTSVDIPICGGAKK